MMGAMGQEASHSKKMIGLEPPRLNEGDRTVVGEDIKRLRKENKQRKSQWRQMYQSYL
jgi:hypothetical protein